MAAEPEHDREKSGAIAQLRNSFVTGVVVVGPLAITVYLARAFLEWVDSNVKPLIPAAWNPDSYLPFAVPGFGLVVALILITMLGALTASLVGRAILDYGEQLVDRTPFVRPVYKTIKQVFETIVSNRENSFSQAGLIQWPRPGIWTIVFVSGPARGEVTARLGTEQDWMTVFIPTTPNPTGGYLMFVPRKDVVLLDMPIEDAAKLVISGGLVVPEFKPAAAESPEHGRVVPFNRPEAT
jgi:uncharacterized membrane protein